MFLGIMKMQPHAHPDAEIVRRAASKIARLVNIYTCNALIDAGASQPLCNTWERFCRRPRWQFWRQPFPAWWNGFDTDANRTARIAALHDFAYYLETLP